MHTLQDNLQQLRDCYSRPVMDQTLKALQLWYSSARTPLSPSSQVPLMMDDLFAMSTDDCIDAMDSLHHLSTRDVTTFSILMEFGLPFATRPGFGLLSEQVEKRLSRQPFLPV